MAIFKCAECGRDISDRATSCPGCGAPVEGGPPRLSGTAQDVVSSESAKSPSKDSELTERFRSTRSEAEICDAIATQFRRLDSKFDAASLSLKTSEGSKAPVVIATLLRLDDQWLVKVTYKENRTASPAAILIWIVIMFLLWTLFSGWAALVLLAIGLANAAYDAAMTAPFSTQQIEQALRNVKNELASDMS